MSKKVEVEDYQEDEFEQEDHEHHNEKQDQTTKQDLNKSKVSNNPHDEVDEQQEDNVKQQEDEQQEENVKQGDEQQEENVKQEDEQQEEYENDFHEADQNISEEQDEVHHSIAEVKNESLVDQPQSQVFQQKPQTFNSKGLANINKPIAKISKTDTIKKKKPVVSKPDPVIRDPPGISQQQKMVIQISKQYKEKEKKIQELDNKLYVEEEVEKKKPKEKKQQIKVKQSLMFKKDIQEKLDDVTKSNQEKAVLLINDLAKKVDKKIIQKDFLKKKIEIKQPAKDTEPKVRPKEKDFNLAIGAGIKSKLQIDADNDEKLNLVKDRNAIQAQRKMEKNKAILQMKQYDAIKLQEKQMAREGEDNLKKENKVLQIVDKTKDKKVSELQYEDNQKEQSLQEEQIRKQLLVQLRHLKEDSNDLQQTLKFEHEKNSKIENQMKEFIKSAKVVDVGGKFSSFGLAPQLKTVKDKNQNLILMDQNKEQGGSNSKESNNVDENSQDEQEVGVGVSELSIAEIIVNKIALQGLTLQDVYHMLDNDGDGVLTMKEIQDGIKKLNLNLSESECQRFISLLDSNSDGVLSEPEFYAALTSTLEAQKEFVAIMGDIKDIANPIELDERKLDLQFRKKLILKKTEHENKKSIKSQPKYDRVVKQLKELETKVSVFQGVPADRIAYLNDMQIQCDKLRKDLLLEQEEKDKLETQLKGKSELIEVNITNLTNELAQKSVLILEAKLHLLESQTDHKQKELKFIAYDGLNQKLLDEMEIKNQQELEFNEKQREFNQIKLKSLEEGKIKQREFQKLVDSVIFIQKMFKGQMARRAMRRKLEKIKRYQMVIFKVIFPKLKKTYSDAFFLIQMQGKKSKTMNQVQDQFQKQHNEKQNSVDKKAKRITARMLVLCIVIQKYQKSRQKRQGHAQKVYGCGFLDLKQNCSVCQQEVVEIICRKCENPLFCTTCFKISHRNYNRRNHQFYEVMSSPGPQGKDIEASSQSSEIEELEEALISEPLSELQQDEQEPNLTIQT